MSPSDKDTMLNSWKYILIGAISAFLSITVGIICWNLIKFSVASSDSANDSVESVDDSVEVYKSEVTKLYLKKEEIDETGNYKLELCIDNNCMDQYEWSISGDGATIFGLNFDYAVYPDLSGGCAGCWFVEEHRKDNNTSTGWKATLRQLSPSDLANTEKISSNQNQSDLANTEKISPDLSPSDLDKYKQDLSQTSDSEEACATRYRMVRGIPYDKAVISFVDSFEYCDSPEAALESLCTMYRGKKVDWVSFGLSDRQVDDK
jgi:hypothetical protein